LPDFPAGSKIISQAEVLPFWVVRCTIDSQQVNTASAHGFSIS
jgi:hypothetical protein